MVVKLNFDSDFTWLLDEEVININHKVKVVTKNSVIECCSVILSQHSDVLRKLLTEEEEIFLDNYTNVRDCLMVLHGGEVTLNIDNILDVLKFSVQFQIDDVYKQCLDWIKDNLSEDNVLDMFKICNSLSKFAKVHGSDICEDIFRFVATYFRMIGPSAVKNLVVAEISIEDTIDFTNFFLSSRSMFISFAKFLFEMISQENVHVMLPLLFKNMDMFSVLSFQQLESFLLIMDSVVVERVEINDAKTQDYFSFKESILLKCMKSKSSFHISESIPDGAKCIIDTLLMNKCWKKMDSNQLVAVHQLFHSPAQHFLYSEMMIAWVIEKKPEIEIVSYITQFLIPYKFNADYFEMLGKKYEALGYEKPISSSMLKFWKQPDHYLNVCEYASQYSPHLTFKLSILCRNAEPCSQSTYYISFIESAIGVNNQRVSWQWYTEHVQIQHQRRSRGKTAQNIDAPPPTYTADFLKCPKESDEVSGEKRELFFNGASSNNDHIPFHTETITTAFQNMAMPLNINCIQFDKPTIENSNTS